MDRSASDLYILNGDPNMTVIDYYEYADIEDETNSATSTSSSIWGSVDFSFYIEGIGIMGVGVVGMLINGLAVVTLSRQKTLRAFHLLLLFMTTYDFFHVFLSICCFSLPQLSSAYRNNILIYIIPYLIPCAQVRDINCNKRLSFNHPPGVSFFLR